jgi:hypothetical protein
MYAGRVAKKQLCERVLFDTPYFGKELESYKCVFKIKIRGVSKYFSLSFLEN